MNNESLLPETLTLQQATTGQELLSTKKQWVKPEARLLNVNAGGDATPDGPETAPTIPS